MFRHFACSSEVMLSFTLHLRCANWSCGAGLLRAVACNTRPDYGNVVCDVDSFQWQHSYYANGRCVERLEDLCKSLLCADDNVTVDVYIILWLLFWLSSTRSTVNVRCDQPHTGHALRCKSYAVQSREEDICLRNETQQNRFNCDLNI